jgi:hypothetical protein
MHGMMMVTAFVRFTSTPLKAFGRCLDRGYDLIEGFLKRTYRCTSASSSLSITFALVDAPYCLLYSKPCYALETHIEPYSKWLQLRLSGNCTGLKSSQ